MTPFLIAVIIVLLLVTYFPPITLWFPDLFMK
jgi:TRAP-type C4-dicarboxylate transport system permease large subunit